MTKIYELLGYPVDDNSSAVVESRKQAYCPLFLICVMAVETALCLILI